MSDHAISHHTDPREFVQQDLAKHDDKALKIDLREIYKQDEKLNNASDRDQTMSRDYVQLKQLGVSEKQLREAGFPSSDTLLKHMVRDNDRAIPPMAALAAEAIASSPQDTGMPPADAPGHAAPRQPQEGEPARSHGTGKASEAGDAAGAAAAAGAAGAAAGALARAGADAPAHSKPKIAPLDMHDFQPPHAAQDHTRVVKPPVPPFVPKHN